MSIATKAMVLNLQIGIWQGYRLDKEASRKVVEDASADAMRPGSTSTWCPRRR
jgi:hypothetical protein